MFHQYSFNGRHYVMNVLINALNQLGMFLRAFHLLIVYVVIPAPPLVGSDPPESEWWRD